MRDIPVGNGSLLVAFDERYQIRDIYFPRVGKENHTEGHAFRFGVWADGTLSWCADNDWTRRLDYEFETLVTHVTLRNEKLGIELTSRDAVDCQENIFLRHLTVRNLLPTRRVVRIFFHHDFYISETEVGDTAFFDPETLSLIHYKGRRYFSIATDSPAGVETFATGRKNFQGAEGTWRDAEDGTLSDHAITEGSVDSTIGHELLLEANGASEMFYWIAAGRTHTEVAALQLRVRAVSPRRLIDRTASYWRAWVNKNSIDFDHLAPEVVRLFKRSLLIIRTQIDEGGAIIAANDSDVTLRATDHYSYMWTRDGALVADALDQAGYSNLTRNFFDLCASIITSDGYFLQKYNADGSPASSWHTAWDAQKKARQLPIQEDETALVIWALWRHYDEFRDIEFINRHYQNLIVRAANFLVSFRDPHTKLPLPSWNLWEDRRGIHAFTCASVVGALDAASRFADLFGDEHLANAYSQAADEVREGLSTHFYRPDLQRFVRMLTARENHKDAAQEARTDAEHTSVHSTVHPNFDIDPTIDASLFGLFYFGAFAADDERIVSTIDQIETNLSVKTASGGIARYEADGYMRNVADTKQVPGNAWFICTLWLAEHKIACARDIKELKESLRLIDWTIARALPSGVLAEQLDPLTSQPVSVSPLTWSHSTFVAVVMSYLRKLEAMRDCALCGRPLFRYDRRAR